MKKTIALLLASMMVLSLAACSDKDSNSSSDNSSAAQEAVTEAPTEEEATEAPTEEEATEAPTEEEAPDNGADAPAEGDTLGQTILSDFQAKMADGSVTGALPMAEALLTNSAIQFSGAAMAVEPGLLSGFGNAEITGFSEGAMFAPMIGSIAFVGYIFTLEDGTDPEVFTSTLKDNADPRWNICVEADETVVDYSGNTVFFLMCPSSLEG